jgi:hypothetical protein
VPSASIPSSGRLTFSVGPSGNARRTTGPRWPITIGP